MPVFGEYETVGEPIAITEERGHTSTVWQARQTGGGAGRLYVVKCYRANPDKAKEGTTHSDEPLGDDPHHEFIEGIKQLKKAQSEGGRCLTPIYAFGIHHDEGAWYVGDFFPGKSLKEWITRRGRVDHSALRHVVHSAALGCLALKRARGYSHGNLKPSNVFLLGKPRPLGQRPMVLADPYPAAPLKLAGLAEADKAEALEMLGFTMQAHDLRGIGELILQLVQGRLVQSAYDYAFPVAPSTEWDRLGKKGEFWRGVCNRLLDPKLSPEKESLERLEEEFRPTLWERQKVPILAAATTLCLVAVFVLFVRPAVSHWLANRRALSVEQNSTRYQTAIGDAQTALDQKDYAQAVHQADVALGIKNNDPAALKLRDDAQRELDLIKAAKDQEQRYQAAMSEAEAAFSSKNYGKAISRAEAALGIKANDPTATKLRENAQHELDLANQAKTREQQYQAAMKDGKAAYAKLDYTNAITQAEIALGLKREDAAAITLKNEAQQGANLLNETIAKEQRYQSAMKDAHGAYDKGDYKAAINQADVALGIKNGDGAATKLRKDAQNQLGLADTVNENQQRYEAAMKSANAAYQRRDYTNAVTLSEAALGIRNGDSAALTLRTNAQAALALAGNMKAQEERYQTAMGEGAAAYKGGDYTNAIKQAAVALGIKAADEAATKLNTEAQQQLNLTSKKADEEQRYQAAIRNGTSAYSQKDYTNAIKHADAALGIRVKDPVATKLRNEAQGELALLDKAAADQQRYVTTMKDGQNAFNRGEYSEAIRLAEAALGIKENDSSGKKLRADAQHELDKTPPRPETITLFNIPNFEFLWVKGVGQGKGGAYVAVNEISADQHARLREKFKIDSKVRGSQQMPAEFANWEEAKAFVAALNAAHPAEIKGRFLVPSLKDYEALAASVGVQVPPNYILSAEALAQLSESENLGKGMDGRAAPIANRQAGERVRLRYIVGNLREWTVDGKTFGVACSAQNVTIDRTMYRDPKPSEKVTLRLILEDAQ